MSQSESRLKVRWGNNPDELAAVLARETWSWRQQERIDPMLPVWIGVSQIGMERLIERRAALEVGIAANLSFGFPTRLLQSAIRVLAGDAQRFDEGLEDAWDPSRLVWTLLPLIEDALGAGEAAFAPLQRWLDSALAQSDTIARDRLLFDLAMRVARLFDGYLLERPEWALMWSGVESGPSVEGITRPDFRHREIREHQWQRLLWERAQAVLAGPEGRHAASRAAQVQREVDPLFAEELRSVMPELHLFGLTSVPPLQRQMIRAVSRVIPVTLYMALPSDLYWADATKDDASVPELLRSFGEEARTTQDVVTALVERTGAPSRDHYTLRDPGTLLADLQRSVMIEGAGPSRDHDAASAASRGEDRTIQFHASWDALRQVETLRDVIIRELDEDPSLDARDVTVLCPDLDRFAPLIESVFSQSEPRLRYRIEDRSLRATNPVADVILQAFGLLESRASAREVVGLLDSSVVRARFGFEESDLDAVAELVDRLGVTWGFSDEEQERISGHRALQTSWQRSLRRSALGLLIADEPESLEDVAGLFPDDAVAGRDLSLVGRVIAYVGTLRHAVDSLRASRSLEEWIRCLAGDATTPPLFARLVETTPQQHVFVREVVEELEALRAHIRESAPATFLERRTLSPALVLRWLAERFDDDGRRIDQGPGSVVFARLSPMRFASSRLICLLGVDDGVFPSGTRPSAWDLRPYNPRRRGEGMGVFDNDRDARRADVYGMLQALLLADQSFAVIYQGADPQKNEKLPPSTPVLELQRLITERYQRDELVERLTVAHRLTPWSPENFRAQRPAASSPFGTQQTWYLSAQAREESRARGPRWRPLLRRGSSAGDAASISFSDLYWLLYNPARSLLREQLDVSLQSSYTLLTSGYTLDDEERSFALREKLMELVERRDETEWEKPELSDDELHRLRLCAALIPGPAGREQAEKQLPDVLATYAAFRAARGTRQAEPHMVTLRIGEDTLSGAIKHVFEGEERTEVHALLPNRKVKAKDAASIQLGDLPSILAAASLSAADRRDVELHLHGVEASAHFTLTPDPSLEGLRLILEVRRALLSEPRPFTASMSHEFVKALGDLELNADDQQWQGHEKLEKALAAAANAWPLNEGGYTPKTKDTPGREKNRELRALFGDDLPFDNNDTSDGVGAIGEQEAHFATLACRLWRGIYLTVRAQSNEGEKR